MAAKDNGVQKKQLNQQITGKNNEITKCNAIKQSLLNEKKDLKSNQRKWKQQYQKHNNSKIASQVVVSNVFQGTIADKLQDCYGTQVDNMNSTEKKIEALCKELDSQIRKLESHVTNLQGQVKTAQTKLNNMED